VYLAILACKAVLSWRYAARHRENEQVQGEVTVLQPILSGDPALESALEHNLQTARPGTHFVWLIDEDDPQAQRITEQLRKKYPEAVTLIDCQPVTGNVNPKLVKLQVGLSAVLTEFVAVLDDDTRLSADHLGKALAALRSCDLYTGLPCYEPGKTLWSSLVAHFVNNNSILTYLPVLPLVGPLTINGMYYVMRGETLWEGGGFTPIRDQLCDDYALARLLRSRGRVIRQGITPQQLRTTVSGPGRYFTLMHRWFVFANLLVRDQPLPIKALLIALLGLPPCLLWIGLLSLCAGLPGALLFAATLLVRYLVIRGLHRVVFGRLLPLSFVLSPVSELLQPIHLLHATLWQTIRWRTRRIRPRPDGTFVYYADKEEDQPRRREKKRMNHG
jgi:ceramide glucosyltransferase